MKSQFAYAVALLISLGLGVIFSALVSGLVQGLGIIGSAIMLIVGAIAYLISVWVFDTRLK